MDRLAQIIQWVQENTISENDEISIDLINQLWSNMSHVQDVEQFIELNKRPLKFLGVLDIYWSVR